MKCIPKISEIYNPVIDAKIPRDIFEHEGLVKKFKSFLRLYRRFLTLCLTNQVCLLKDIIPNDVKRVLWINISSTSIGDSIMELSGRVLLKDAYQLDLLTDSRNVSLYQDDDIFHNVYSYPPTYIKYDFIILDILNTKSICFKARYFAKVPFVTLRGYWLGTYMGSDYNRMLFSYHRINKLLSLKYDENCINSIAQNYLTRLDKPNFLGGRLSVTVAVGGEDPIRTYNKWHDVLSMLLNTYPDLTINLVGSSNGIKDADRIIKLCNQISNYVGKLTLVETRNLIANSDVFIGSDGGLMHIAEAYNLSGVALFALFKPSYRLSYHSRLLTIITDRNVNDIDSYNVYQLVSRVINTKTAIDR